MELIFHVVEKLPNLVQDGVLKKIFAEIVTETKQTSKETTIQGSLVITRELKMPNRNSEIAVKDSFPIDIKILNNQKIIQEAEVSLNIHTFNIGFDSEYTEFSGEFELTNVIEKAQQLV